VHRFWKAEPAYCGPGGFRSVENSHPDAYLSVRTKSPLTFLSLLKTSAGASVLAAPSAASSDFVSRGEQLDRAGVNGGAVVLLTSAASAAMVAHGRPTEATAVFSRPRCLRLFPPCNRPSTRRAEKALQCTGSHPIQPDYHETTTQLRSACPALHSPPQRSLVSPRYYQSDRGSGPSPSFPAQAFSTCFPTCFRFRYTLFVVC